jgi:hypothetical protein
VPVDVHDCAALLHELNKLEGRPAPAGARAAAADALLVLTAAAAVAAAAAACGAGWPAAAAAAASSSSAAAAGAVVVDVHPVREQGVELGALARAQPVLPTTAAALFPASAALLVVVVLLALAGAVVNDALPLVGAAREAAGRLLVSQQVRQGVLHALLLLPFLPATCWPAAVAAAAAARVPQPPPRRLPPRPLRRAALAGLFLLALALALILGRAVLRRARLVARDLPVLLHNLRERPVQLDNFVLQPARAPLDAAGAGRGRAGGGGRRYGGARAGAGGPAAHQPRVALGGNLGLGPR